jgi:hypothetical protein
MTIKHLEVCIGEIQPRDDYCKECLEQPKDNIRQHYCYVPCQIPRDKIQMPLPLSDEELEAEYLANYRMVMK